MSDDLAQSQFPHKVSAHPSPESRCTLPSLQSLHLPFPLHSTVDNPAPPSIHSASGTLSQFTSPCPYASHPASARLRNDSPLGRLPPLLSSHFSTVVTNDVSNDPSTASQLPSCRVAPPPHPPSTDSHPATPQDISPITTERPPVGYSTPTKQVPKPIKRVTFRFRSDSDRARGNYKCTHPGCTVSPFQNQSRLE